MSDNRIGGSSTYTAYQVPDNVSTKAAKVLGLEGTAKTAEVAARADVPAHSSGIGDKIRTAFQSFASGVANLARSGFEALKGLVSRAPEAQVPASAPANGADAAAGAPAPAPKAPPLNDKAIELFNSSKEKLSSYVDDWMESIAAEAKANGRSNLMTPTGGEMKEADPTALRDRKLTDMVTDCNASAFKSLKPDVARALAAECRANGETGKADFLDKYVSLVDGGRTTDGAKALFWEKASAEMKAPFDNPATFLRTTEAPGTACAKKLMDTTGVDGYKAAIQGKLDAIMDRADVKALAAKLREDGIAHTTHEKLSESDAHQLFGIMLDIFNEVRSIPAPADSRAMLADLKAEVDKRTDDAAAYGDKLFADQVMLKLVSPAVTTYIPKDDNGKVIPDKPTTVLRMAWDFASIAANGVQDSSEKYHGGAHPIYMQNGAGFRADMNDFLQTSWGR